MNYKSVVVGPMVLLMWLAGAVSAIMIAVTHGSIAWAGAFLAVIPLPVYMAVVIHSGKVARTSRNLPWVQLLTALGLVLVLYSTIFVGLAAAPLVLALIGFGFLQWFVRGYSSYGRGKSQAIVLGQPLPDIEFHTLDGQSVTPHDFAGAKTLLVFFRGNWCPLCMAQLKEICARADELAKNSVQVKFISNQSIDQSKTLTEELSLRDNFEVLQDRDLRVAKALAIADIGGTPAMLKDYPADTVMATVIALDEEGRVIFGDEAESYRVRPHPDRFMPVLSS